MAVIKTAVDSALNKPVTPRIYNPVTPQAENTPTETNTPETRIYPDYLYGKRETAWWLNIGQSTLDDWVRKGLFPKGLRIGGRKVAWLGSDILDYINNLVEQRNGGAQ